MKETVLNRFLLGVVRHLVSKFGGILVGWGVAESLFTEDTQAAIAGKIVAGLMFFGAAIYYSYRDKIWEFLKTRIGILLPPNTPISEVVDIAKTVINKTEVANGGVDVRIETK